MNAPKTEFMLKGILHSLDSEPCKKLLRLSYARGTLHSLDSEPCKKLFKLILNNHEIKRVEGEMQTKYKLFSYE